MAMMEAELLGRLTPEELEIIGQIVDQRVDAKFEEFHQQFAMSRGVVQRKLSWPKRIAAVLILPISVALFVWIASAIPRLKQVQTDYVQNLDGKTQKTRIDSFQLKGGLSSTWYHNQRLLLVGGVMGLAVGYVLFLLVRQWLRLRMANPDKLAAEFRKHQSRADEARLALGGAS
jgi:hypothetical protein